MRDTAVALLGWRRWVPWSGRATGADGALMVAIGVVIALGFVMRMIRPFLIASNPVLLEFLSGGLAEIGAAAAFARIGEVPLWLVVVAGSVGIMKFDWLTWWAGRRWGPGLIGYFTTRENADRLTERGRHLNPWLLRLAVLAAPLPGVPGVVMTMLAGWTGMRLRTFLVLDALGAFGTTALVAGLGYALGQGAVDVVLLIERQAVWVTLGLIAVTVAVPMVKRAVRRLAESRAVRAS
ncbi:membrane protein [Brevibacterium daeguense]|uniref:Membrane protein n=1 Tax=Brevibacterium daeguense TaxID=909936 RepID=A0ABP8EGV4_9MICO|nr:VTT domain-containing protein [Brevibacterium daeguense]